MPDASSDKKLEYKTSDNGVMLTLYNRNFISENDPKDVTKNVALMSQMSHWCRKCRIGVANVAFDSKFVANVLEYWWR